MKSKARKIALSFLIMAVAVSMLVVATRAWFLNLNETAAGTVAAGTVNYLPKGEQTPETLLRYGNLISGSSISPDGIPHVLPGDRLLAATSTQVDGSVAKQTVNTTIARPYQSGETQGTVIYGETRWFTDETGKILSARRLQRDLMATEILPEEWTDDNGTPIEKPLINSSQYNIVTTTSQKKQTVGNADITDTILTTVYTNRENAKVYRNVRTTRVTVTHEAPSFSDATLNWADALPYPYIETEEIVLAVTNNITRSRILITEYRLAAGETGSPEEASLPLSLGNLSTVPTNVRMGISAVLLTGETEETLQTRQSGGGWYIGKQGSTGDFIELFEISPSVRDRYGWTYLGMSADGYLWDLALTGGKKEIPAIPSPQEGEEPKPEVYAAIDRLEVASESHFGLNQAIFEDQFNKLYCKDTPKIRLQIRYYAKQNDYMDWSEFLSDSITMQF